MAKSYSKPPITPAKFDDSLIPRPTEPTIADRTVEQLETLQKSLQSKDKAFDEAQAKLAGMEEKFTSHLQEASRPDEYRSSNDVGKIDVGSTGILSVASRDGDGSSIQR